MEATESMIRIGADDAVNEVIRTHPGTVEIFNRFGIDACCGGAASIHEAAVRDGADPAALLASLNEDFGMPRINRQLSGSALLFDLRAAEREDLIDEQLLVRGGRSARTLVKEDSLRVTLVALAPGGVLAEHRADGAITLQVLSGQLRFKVGSDNCIVGQGSLISLPSGIPHSVESADGCEFLLTVGARVVS